MKERSYTRVAIVTQCLALGGTQTYLLGVIGLLKRLGIDVLVVADGGPMVDQFRTAGAEVVLLPQLMEQTSLFYPAYFRTIPGHYKRNLLNIFPTWRNAALADKAGLFLIVKLLLARTGVRKYADHSRRNFQGTGGLLHASGRLAEEFGRFQPDMVLTSQIQPTIASLRARDLTRGQYPVHEFIMSLINCMDIPAPWRLHRPQLGDRLLSTTGEISDELAAIRPRGAILAVGNCIDDETFAPQSSEKRLAARARYGLDARDFVVVHMSSLTKQKWPMAQGACEAFIKFLQSGRRGKFVLVGPGDDMAAEFQQFREEAGRIAGADCMSHLGPVSEDMQDVLNVGNVFVGVGRCTREAMLCGVPSIVYGLQGHPGIVDAQTAEQAHYYNFAGRGCDRASSSDNLALELVKLSDMTDEERRELGLWSREFVRERDSYSFLAKQLGLTASEESKVARTGDQC